MRLPELMRRIRDRRFAVVMDSDIQLILKTGNVRYVQQRAAAGDGDLPCAQKIFSMNSHAPGGSVIALKGFDGAPSIMSLT